jgi:hypothetical protein
MSRLSIPADVDELIKVVSPYISSSTNAVDTIRTALFRMKEQYVLSNPVAIGINNPLHPYYAHLTPEEEEAVLEYRKNPDLGKKLGTPEEIKAYLNSL